MRAFRVVLALCAAGAVVGAAPPAGAADALFHLDDPRLAEVSGIAVGIASPGVVYVHNDSGDSARFFALDARTGRVLAVYTVPGVANTDWEDIAVARDSRGVASVWICDIGDNDHARGEIEVYRVDEPRVDTARRDVAATTGRPDVWRLRYAGGATDAESLAVAPGGAAYVVTKSLAGASVVYAVPPHPDANGIQLLGRVGEVTFRPTGTAGPFAVLGQLTATAADISRDGSCLVVRTYTDAYLWPLHDGDVAAALATAPVRVPLPEQPQGEGIAVDGTRLLIDSEHVGSAVFAVPMPAVTPPAASTPPSPSIDTVPSVTTTPGPSGSHWVTWLVILGAALVIATPLLDRFILRRGSRANRNGER